MSISLDSLKEAIAIKEQITRLEGRLSSILGGGAVTTPKAGRPAKKKRKMSAAGRARIAAAQKARWAKVKKDSTK